jgi:hypothetical protein
MVLHVQWARMVIEFNFQALLIPHLYNFSAFHQTHFFSEIIHIRKLFSASKFNLLFCFKVVGVFSIKSTVIQLT